MIAPNYDAVNAPGSIPNTQEVFDAANTGSADKRYQSAMSGTEAAKGLLGPDRGFEQSLGRGDAMSTAIQQKQNRVQSLEDEQLKFAVKNKSDEARFNQLMSAQDLVGKEQAMNYQKAIARYKAKMISKAQRSALVGQMLGLVGAVGGGVAAGPGGAMAGMAAGQTVGTAASGGFD